MVSIALKVPVASLILVSILVGSGAAYKPSVQWGGCPKGYPPSVQCGTIDVPMNYDKPNGDKVTLSFAHLKANQTCSTSPGLFLENGGPGASNMEGLATQALNEAKGLSSGPANDALRLTYDQIGLDMRGTGYSVPIKCDPQLWDAVKYPIITDEAIYEDVVDRARAFGQSCINMTGPLIEHLGTDQTIQDFDLVRNALGYDKFNYLGFSYGTKIGYDYAQKYPQNVGRMVLDGLTNYDYSIEDKWSTSALGVETTFNDFFRWCNTTTECALHGQDQPRIFDTIVDWAAKGELKNSTCVKQRCDNENSTVADWQVVISMDTNLHDGTQPGLSQNWQNVSIALNYTYVERSDLYLTGPPSSATTSSVNWTIYSEINIQCADRPERKLSVADFRNINTLLGTLTPHTRGLSIQSRVNDICNEWPVAARNPPKANLDQMRKLPPIMLVNAFFDPATPSPWGLGIRAQLPTAFSVYRNGGGHTSFSHQGETAMAEAAFLVNGTIPIDGIIYQT